MSIDARVQSVRVGEDGSGELRLIDRPPSRPGANPGCRGQSSLKFDSAPEEVTALSGLDIWGGSGGIMLGDREIAKRDGYTKIRFVEDESFKSAVCEYHKLEKK